MGFDFAPAGASHAASTKMPSLGDYVNMNSGMLDGLEYGSGTQNMAFPSFAQIPAPPVPVNQNIMPSYANGMNYVNGMTPTVPNLSDQLKNAQIDAFRSSIETNDLANAALLKEQNSLMGQMSPYITGFAGVAQGLGSLAGIYTGFQQLDIAKSQLGIAEEQWGETKNELARVKKVRSDLNTSYKS